jgi:chromosome partitioning protein
LIAAPHPRTLHCNIETGSADMTANVITVAQQKGGAGKTTVAAHMALAFHAFGKSVGVLDIDPQGSLKAWFDQREALGAAPDIDVTMATVAGWRMANEVDRLKAAHDVVVIDSPPHAETEAKNAIRAADIVLIPVQPSPMDLWAIKPTLSICASERVSALLVLNRVPPRGRLLDAVSDALKADKMPVAKTTLGNRVAYAQAMMEGRGVTEAQASSRAAGEIRALAREVAKAVGLSVKKGA